MDFKNKLESIENKINSSIIELKETKKELKECVCFTHKFLDICRELGIKKVAVGISHDSIESCKNWPHEYGSAFADERDKEGVWPAIWRATELAGVGAGCGNTGQHQLNALGVAKLIDGCYHLKNGKWRKVD